MNQTVLKASHDYKELDEYLSGNGIRSFLLVCGESLLLLGISAYFEKLEGRTGIRFVKFSDFCPNPSYESVVKGVQLFRKNRCQGIIAVGGGSAIDVAKCIRLFSNMEGDGKEGSFLRQTVVPNDINMLVVPTTAGSGAEATRYAVVYHDGEKQSVMHNSCIPDAVLMDSSVLKTLPLYQKKSAMLDALCHGIESYWSVNSTDESKTHSKETVRLILEHKDGYLANDDYSSEKMLEAAYTGGKAINITQTTAGHAMCYKLTGLYGISHGHAAALCVKELWPWMIRNTGKCTDKRGEEYLKSVFEDLSRFFGCTNTADGAVMFGSIVEKLNMAFPAVTDWDVKVLQNSVNTVRLKNNPVKLSEDDISGLYHKILFKGCMQIQEVDI